MQFMASILFYKKSKTIPRDGCHHGEDERVAVLPVKLGHVPEIHPVKAHSQH
jgi:hypothetical protein